MTIKTSQIVRFVVTLFIFVAINLFGLYDFHEDGLFLFLNSYDFILVVLNLLFGLLFFQSSYFRKVLIETPLRYILYIYLFILLVFLSMPFRGDISVIDAIRVGRHYLILPVTFLIYYDVAKQNKSNYYWKIFRFIAVFTSFQIVINAISPGIINSIFSDIGRAASGYKHDYQRNVLLSASMLFPHIASINYYYKLLTERFQASNLVLFLFLLLGSSLQGFRSYLIILVFILLLLTLMYGKIVRQSYKWIVVLVTIIPITFFVDAQYLNNQIYGKFYTAYNEITESTGSYQGRLRRVQIRQIPMLLEKPLLGWGFIYYDSEYGKQLNLPRTGVKAHLYGLYTVDSGYITILMQFGLIGVLFIFFWLFRYSIKLYKNRNHSPPIITTIGIIIILVVSLYTHGAFFREFGLVPFTMMLGLTAKIN